jgi:hypothetical protein
MSKRLKSCLIALMFAVMPLSATAENNDTVTGDKATDMVVDLVVVRPLGLAATVIGTVLTVVALPFTIPSGSVESSARELIVKPAEYTFSRPLGEFHRCGADRHPCGMSER